MPGWGRIGRRRISATVYNRLEELMPLMKRVYKFIGPEHALTTLQAKRLKISRFSECNDPFELAALDLKDKNLRSAHRKWLIQTDKTRGMLCFCQHWKNPVMWGHYAKNHTGICLGFDVDPSKLTKVKYVQERLFPDLNANNFSKTMTSSQMLDVLSTKFIHWSYEEEFRMFIGLEKPSPAGKLDFQDFSEALQLKEVILGFNSKISKNTIQTATQLEDAHIIRARMAFKTFAIVPQKNPRLQN